MSLDTKILTIDLGTRAYDVYIGSGLIYRFADFLPFESEGNSFFIVCDDNTRAYAEIVRNTLRADGASKAEMITLTPGEASKSWESAQRLLEWLVQQKVERSSCIIAVGGGVIGDISGFCAAVILRGIAYVQIPTTLLAQVDSSVGGKTGLNMGQTKNMVGAFHQPVAVIADLDALKNLPRRQLLAGYAEIVKIALLGDAPFFRWLETHASAMLEGDWVAMAQAIETAVRAKARIVEADEREQGGRALLNLGHTFAHALETATGFDGRLLHGEAVAIGMVLAFDLSVRLGLCTAEDQHRVEEHLSAMGLPIRIAMIDPPLKISPQEILALMRHDKKVENGSLRLILPSAMGVAHVADDVDEAQIINVLKDSLGSEYSGKDIKNQWKSVFFSR
ncbi:MAG: 3-dehydroquinate synthase [Alphaproteobacteria bacterium]|nr:3-dehydroquinate synthase [Alphaproteobacteria bacterium]